MLKATEQDLAKKVVDWLLSDGWDVYQEVKLQNDTVCDIVAVRPESKRLWLIECKTSLGFAVFDQALRNQSGANWVSVAVPQKSKITKSATILHNETGIGIIHVPGAEWATISKSCLFFRPKLQRCRNSIIISRLCEEHKTYCPAGSDGSAARFTPYTQTCSLLRSYVNDHPGCGMREACQAIKHHYGCDETAYSALLAWVKDGKLRGIEARYELAGKRKRWKIYLKEVEE